MATRKINELQQSSPLHLENSVLQMGRKDLRSDQAFFTYRDMKLDGVVAGSLSFIKAMLSKGDWNIGYRDDFTAQEKAVIDALNVSLGQLPYNKKNLLNNFLSMLDYGCSIAEVVLERKSNGLFVFRAISPIHLTTVNQFKFENGELKAIRLVPADNDGLLDFGRKPTEIVIDGEKILLFRIEADQDFPLGKSLLYGAYTSWRTKLILQEYEAIGVAKNLSGVLSIRVPSEYIADYLGDPSSDNAIFMTELLQQAELLHAGKSSFVVVPSDTSQNGVPLFELKPIGGEQAASYDVGAAIERYNKEILLALQCAVLALGQSGGGSFALSDNQTNLLSLFIQNIQACINSEFQKAIKLAFEANGLSAERIPNLVFEEIQSIDWDEFTKGWQRLAQAGLLTPTEELESYFRDKGDAPPADYTRILKTNIRADTVDRMDDEKKG